MEGFQVIQPIAMQLVVNSYQFLHCLYHINSKAYDWIENLCPNQQPHWYQWQNMIKRIYFASLLVGDGGLLSVLLAFCQQFVFVPHFILIIFSMLLACLRVFGYISGPKCLLLVKTIQATTSHIDLHRLRAVDIKFLILIWQQYPHHRK